MLVQEEAPESEITTEFWQPTLHIHPGICMSMGQFTYEKSWQLLGVYCAAGILV